MQPVIELKDLTKDYGQGRGIFGMNLAVEEGEMVGFVGTNGSGKTTTIRSIMGFLKPTSGKACVHGMETWQHASEIVRDIGYVPGEIAFPDLATGTAFLKSQAEFLHVRDVSYVNDLVEKLQLDPRAPLKRMSKGMKQKTAIVAALMADPKIILLDEPSTGLDPLMRDVFLSIIEEEHARGKTIFMSSHMFEELENTCNRVALIRDGYLTDIADMEKIRNRPEKEFKIEFSDEAGYREFKTLPYAVVRDQEIYHQVTVLLPRGELDRLFGDLTRFDVRFISEIPYSLERHFKEVLKEEKEKKSHVQ